MNAAFLVLAATLTSPHLGDFFTLPSWLPDTDIASHETIGSDPDAGGGWYVDEVTNGVVLAETWKVYDQNGDEIPNYDDPTYYGDWYWIAAEPPSDLYPVPSGTQTRVDPPFLIGDENAENLNWLVIYDHPEMRFERYFTAERDKSIQPIATGRRVPRACRLTPENQTSVNASFEGFFERMYYASQAQTNGWQTSVYGPPTHKRFRFDLPQGYGVFEYSTNRTIRTRRLAEYDALTNLEHYVRQDFFWNGSVANVVRPGWFTRSPISLWWSTTAEPMPDGFVPTFDWKENPTETNGWGNACGTYWGLVGDDVWDLDTGSSEHVNDYGPAYSMMSKIDLGHVDYYPYNCVWSNGRELTMRQLIETNFPHADGWAITNQTRRMQSEHVCCLNQFLGLMDRTYHEPEVYYPTSGTNVHYYNNAAVIGTSHATLSWDWENRRYDVTPGSISWGSATLTNYVDESNSPSSGTAYHWRIRNTQTQASVHAMTDIMPTIISDDFIGMVIYLARQGGFSPAETGEAVEINVVPQSDGYARFDITGLTSGVTYTHYEKLVDENLNDTDLTIVLSYLREYTYAHTTGYITIGPNQPGRDALQTSRATLSRYGCVSGYKSRTGNVSPTLAEFVWQSSDTVRYKSAVQTYTQRSQLLSAIETAQGSVYSRLTQAYGFAPTAWQSIIPIDMTDVNKVRDSVAFQQGVKIRFNPVNGHTVVRAMLPPGGGYFVTEVYSEWIQGQMIQTLADYIQLYIVELDADFEHESPEQQERDGIAVDGKAGMLTRTDWTWKTLKRTDD